MEENSRTLELPPGYTIAAMEAESGAGNQMLLLKRADGSPVVAFEFSALGPGPARIHEIAVEDEQRVAALREGHTVTGDDSITGSYEAY